MRPALLLLAVGCLPTTPFELGELAPQEAQSAIVTVARRGEVTTRQAIPWPHFLDAGVDPDDKVTISFLARPLDGYGLAHGTLPTPGAERSFLFEDFIGSVARQLGTEWGPVEDVSIRLFGDCADRCITTHDPGFFCHECAALPEVSVEEPQAPEPVEACAPVPDDWTMSREGPCRLDTVRYGPASECEAITNTPANVQDELERVAGTGMVVQMATGTVQEQLIVRGATLALGCAASVGHVVLDDGTLRSARVRSVSGAGTLEHVRIDNLGVDEEITLIQSVVDDVTFVSAGGHLHAREAHVGRWAEILGSADLDWVAAETLVVGGPATSTVAVVAALFARNVHLTKDLSIGRSATASVTSALVVGRLGSRDPPEAVMDRPDIRLQDVVVMGDQSSLVGRDVRIQRMAVGPVGGIEITADSFAGTDLAFELDPAPTGPAALTAFGRTVNLRRAIFNGKHVGLRLQDNETVVLRDVRATGGSGIAARGFGAIIDAADVSIECRDGGGGMDVDESAELTLDRFRVTGCGARARE